MEESALYQQLVLRLIGELNIGAVIFDLDGTLIDNNPWHLQAWKKYLQEKQLHISEENYRKHINGRTNKDAIEYLYGRKMTDEEAMQFALEKEAIYRELYAPFIKPVEGLLPFLAALQNAGIKMAIATSGIPVNIEFMFTHLPIRKYFDAVIHSGHIINGKPDPEIYRVAASTLKIPPENCLVFEDAAVGIASAKAAKMKCVALTTTQPVSELGQANFISPDFSAKALLSAMFSQTN
ncbi:MAG: HAD family phosphatase [Ferruginibacter sp.]|nr:HAD family phosphatase [Ferruginibacter sp.]